jgi:GAF domain-containing protein
MSAIGPKADVGQAGQGPFGVLEVDSRQLRKFEQDDIDFLQNYANLLASAIDRVRIQRELASARSAG